MSDEEREYLNEMIRNLNNRLIDALRERDEARRMACGKDETIGGAMIEADLLGWDCFKTEADACNKKFRKGDINA